MLPMKIRILSEAKILTAHCHSGNIHAVSNQQRLTIMKTLSLLLIASLFFTSCESGGNASGDTATSTSVDSTNMNGEAPVQYGPNDPLNDSITSTGTQEQVIQNNAGMSNRQNNGGMANGPVSTERQSGDNNMSTNRSGGNASGQQSNNPPSSTNTANNPKMQSNTMDARTSGGSTQGTGGTGGRR